MQKSKFKITTQNSKIISSSNLITKGTGFTLVELVVVISVFSLIVLTASTLFVSMVQQQRRALAQQELLNQTSYVIEYMSRALRMAKKDTTGSCLGTTGINYLLTRSNSGVKFINHSNNDICQEFFLENERLKESKDGGTTSVPLTSESLKVNYFKINLSGESGECPCQHQGSLPLPARVREMDTRPARLIQRPRSPTL